MQNRKTIIIIICALALLSVALYVPISRQIHNNNNLIGTYNTSGGQPVDGEYFVFQSDGNYIKYRQFQILEQGAYRMHVNEDARIITLSGGSAEKQILHVRGRLYEFTANGTIAIYGKISELPYFINVNYSPMVD